MARTRGPDEAGEAELFWQVYRALRRFAGAVRPVGMNADDLVGEAVARTMAVRRLESLDEPAAYLRTAMVRIASNAAGSGRRARRRDARVATPDAADDAYPSDIDDLMRVPVRARAVLYPTIVEDLSYRDAAPVVGCSEEAARTLASRALRELRAQLKTEVEPEAAS